MDTKDSAYSMQWECSMAHMVRKFSSFWLYFLVMWPTEHVPVQPIGFIFNVTLTSLFMAQGRFYNYKTSVKKKHNIKSHNLPGLKFEMSLVLESLFYNGAEWRKFSWGGRVIFHCTTVATGQNWNQGWAAPGVSRSYCTSMLQLHHSKVLFFVWSIA